MPTIDVKFLRRPPLAAPLRPTYTLLFNGAVASLPDDLRDLLRLTAPRGPLVPATGALLAVTGKLLGTPPGAQHAAMRRLARLDGAAELPAA